MSIFDWFRPKKPSRESEFHNTQTHDHVRQMLPATPPFESSAEEVRAVTLTKIWKSNGSRRYTMSKGTLLWHGGTVSTFSELDDTRSLWCTCEPSRMSLYDESARENAKFNNLKPARLTITTTRALDLADFGGASLLQFTYDYCDYQHNQMKIALRDWCLAQGFDGVQNINRSSDEVVICKPAQDLRIQQVQSL